MRASLTGLGLANSGFGALGNFSIALCVSDSILVGFYLPLTSGQNYLLLTTPSRTFLFAVVWEPEFLTFFQ
jgi:hypothetical protein